MSNGTDDATAEGTTLVSVPEILTTVGDEVRMLSDGLNDLQDLIGNLVVAGAFGGSPSLYGLQSLDRLCQNLDAISDFLGGVSRLSSADWKVDVAEASRAVRLAELSGRLNGVKSDASACGEGETGDFEDFESWPLTA